MTGTIAIMGAKHTSASKNLFHIKDLSASLMKRTKKT